MCNPYRVRKTQFGNNGRYTAVFKNVSPGGKRKTPDWVRLAFYSEMNVKNKLTVKKFKFRPWTATRQCI